VSGPQPPTVSPADADAFERVRPRLFGIAYRVLGSAADAEDVVQDAWLRWQGADRSVVRDAPAFLATTVTRLAINAAGSARARRETYVGPWLPEPVATGDDPLLGAERGEALDLAVLLLLEALTPTERGAYVLREAFDYPYRRIAEVLEVGEANARQLVTRARRHLDRGPRTSVGPEERARLLQAVVAAAREGDLATLEGLLAADVVALSDGGGVVTAARIPLQGRDRVARFLVAVGTKFWDGAAVEEVAVNGSTALLVTFGDGERLVATLDASAGGIDRLMLVLNPEKLGGVAAR
jgi:RNA polymerase sigma-70 factor (ECF subfamily)